MYRILLLQKSWKWCGDLLSGSAGILSRLQCGGSAGPEHLQPYINVLTYYISVTIFCALHQIMFTIYIKEQKRELIHNQLQADESDYAYLEATNGISILSRISVKL